MNIAIIGFGREGRAAHNYWQNGNSITVCDQKVDLQLPSDVTAQLGADYLHDLDRFDLIVRSPFVRPDALINAASAEIIPKITSNTNEFLRVCPTRNIIGITGTKGKGTTSTLVTKMLEAAGKTVHLGGNIGTAALSLLDTPIQPEDWVVLELSSYQLIDLRSSPTYAACLMVMPEHLDWHSDLAEYIAAKQQLFRWQTPEDITVFYPENSMSTEITTIGSGQKIPYMQAPGAFVQNERIVIADHVICDVNELKLVGAHNWQNVCAAATLVWQITQDIDAIRSAATSFSGLPFRIEFRREANGLRYYNDSFATGPGSCIAAMRAIVEPKVMILGGFERGLDLSELAEEIIAQGDALRGLLLIGQTKDRLASTLTERGFTNFTLSEAQTMPKIIVQASALAQPGDAVVLSPGFASFDMFKDFEDRGRQFNAAVEAL